jgi:hypothetical protein
MLFTLITLPSTAEFFSSVGQWSSALFDELKPVLYLVVGLGLAVAFGLLILRLASWLIGILRGHKED